MLVAQVITGTSGCSTAFSRGTVPIWVANSTMQVLLSPGRVGLEECAEKGHDRVQLS